MNQTTENIACNSDYYNVILDINLRNNKFYKLLKKIRNHINYSIGNEDGTSLSDGMLNFPKFNMDYINKYFNINFFDEPFSIYVKTRELNCDSFVLAVRLQAKHVIIINSKEYTRNGKDNEDTILYQGWPVVIINRIKNTPSQGKDTVTIQYSQNIFHFTFHPTKSKLANNVCVSEDWENKSKGAFHMIIDCFNSKRRKNPRTPLINLEPNDKPYIPFVYDTSNNRFLTFPAIIGNPENHLYTSRLTLDGITNMCHNYSTDLWYMATNGKSFHFLDNSGNRKDYIKEVINPMFNYIMGQLNHSLRLPSSHALSLDRPDTFGQHPLPTPVACDKIPTPSNIIRCASDPIYSERGNESRLDALSQRENKSKSTKAGGNKRTTVRKKSMKGRGRTRSKN